MSQCIEKVCTGCGQLKLASSFYLDRRRKSGLQSRCKACDKWRFKTASYRAKKKEYDKHYYIKYNYGISLEEYNMFVVAQKGVCLICSKKCFRHKRLSIDHDHKTGKIRGLLCHKCNNGLGLFNDSPVLLKKAAEYVSMY